MQVKTKAAKPFNKPTILAAGALTLAMMMPLSASAHHDEPDILEAILGAAVVYTIIDSLDDDHDRHRHRQHRDRHHRYDRSHHGRPIGHHRKHGHYRKAHRRAHRDHHYLGRDYRRYRH